MVDLRTDWRIIAQQYETNPDSGVTIDHLAYVIYTSGSTGRPKGVMISHRGIYNRLMWMQAAYRLTQDDRVAQKTPFSFDVSVWEFFWPLLTGACLVMARPGGHQDPSYLVDLIAAQRISTLHFVPSMLSVFLLERDLAACGGLRRVICSGEALPVELHERFAARLGAALHNLYGPTEASVDVTYWACASGAPRRTVPIGRPIANTQIYLLDRQLNPVPIGVAGELYIGGVQLARGYLGRSELTAERFIPNPFARVSGVGSRVSEDSTPNTRHPAPDTRLYKTGDLARYGTDGAIEFLGRIDHQVKIRGFRIELGEVEAALGRHLAVQESAVVMHADASGDQRLAAYVVPRVDQPVAAEHDGTSWQAEQVTRWQMLYDETYRQPAPLPDPLFNISGWNSSYTGQPIPAAEMREWVDQTVERILALHPRRVLEIGCGTGLLLFQVAPHCAHYCGTDFSPEALRYLQHQLATQPLPQVTLLERTADDFDDLAAASFDIVVLNSVIQYFPSVDYLVRVLEQAAQVVAPGGFIFVGDVRSLPLLEAFHTSVECHRAPAESTRAQLQQRVRQRVAYEEELVVDPAFFAALRQRLPRIGAVAMQLKHGRHHNELTRFRYDVLLQIGTEGARAAEPVSLDWQREQLSIAKLRQLLVDRAPEQLSVVRVPNARLVVDLQAVEWLARSDGAATAGDLHEALRGAAETGIDPEALWSLEDELPYDVAIGWSGAGAPECCDVVLRRPPAVEPAGWRATVWPAEPVRLKHLKPWSAYANNPLKGTVTRALAPQLREFLKAQLPEYMVPATFVLLEALPLTPSGKVDRRALPAPERTRPASEGAAVAPRNPIEEVLASVWADVLGVEQVGIHDHFFNMGGHSLLATQVISRLREIFHAELPLRSLFEAPTVAELARWIDTTRWAAQATYVPRLAPADRVGDPPLSYAQQRLWFLDQLQPGSPVYNVPSAVRLDGPLVVGALAQSLRVVVARHETLRTTFAVVDGQPVQVIAPLDSAPVATWLRLLDLGGLPADARERMMRRLAHAEARRPFDLAHGPLLRAMLLRLDAQEYVLLVTMHHIVSDGWSIGVLIRELAAVYAAGSTGHAATLPPLPIQYADFAIWQRQWLQGAALETQLAYWRRLLGGELPVLQLPTDRPRPTIQTFAGALQSRMLPADLTDALKALSERAGTTLFMTLLAAFQILLGRYADQEDMLVGSPIANRNRAEIESLIGFFVNTLVLRTDLSGDPRFTELLARVREVCLGAYAHQDLPFERLVEELQPQRSLNQQPLFQVLFALQNTPLPVLALTDVILTPLAIDAGAAPFDLALSVEQTEDRLRGVIEYNTDLFDATTIARVFAHFRALLEGIVAQPERRLGELPLLSTAERQQLLVEWNAVRGVRGQVSGVRSTRLHKRHVCLPRRHEGAKLPKHARILVSSRLRGWYLKGSRERRTYAASELLASDSWLLTSAFEAQAARTPDAIAIVFDGTTDDRTGTIYRAPTTTDHRPPTTNHQSVFNIQYLTYRELNERANRLAHHLRSLGVVPDARVGLYLERSLELVIGLLGVLKAGGAYVPLDPAYPARRIAFILDDAQASILLTQTALDDGRWTIDDATQTNSAIVYRLLSIVYLDADWPVIARQPAHAPEIAATSAHLAYLIYTSGSTGQPKAVLVEHGNLVSALRASQRQFGFHAQDVMPWIAAATFDIALFELLNPLLAGGTVILLRQHDVLDLPRLLTTLERCTVFHTVPSLMRQIVQAIAAQRPDPDRFARMRMVFVGGEAVPAELLAEMQKAFARAAIVVLYGPTEATIIAASYLAARAQPHSGQLIGVPLPNVQLHLCDRHGQPVPIGVAGELYIGGAGVTRGYLGRPDLTAARFIPNPFAMPEDERRRTKDEGLDSSFVLRPSSGTRLYKTGDLARYRPDGTLEFLGRIDHQIKLRGFRVELGEVEQALLRHSAVREGVVVARADGLGDQQLVAYLVPHAEHAPMVGDLRRFLQAALPDYMVPAAFVFLGALPLTPNNKIDRAALPAPDQVRPTLDKALVAPRTRLEQLLADMWRELLGPILFK